MEHANVRLALHPTSSPSHQYRPHAPEYKSADAAEYKLEDAAEYK